MAIKNLTHQKPQFPQIGQLRKGEWLKEENRAIDLDHFRFTSDLPEIVEKFHVFYGDEPRLINVFLPHQTTDENWDAWYEEYLASGLIHRCDGEYVTRYRDQQTGSYVDPSPGTLRCPYHSGEKERTNNRPGCQPQGRLQVVIREFKRFAYVMVITSSKNDIINLDGQLRALESIHGKLTGIPMILMRRPERISTPKMEKKDGQWVQTTQRQRRESWLLSIEASPEWAEMEMESQRLQALPDLPKQLTAPGEKWSVEAEEQEPPPVEVVEPEVVESEVVEPEKPAMTLGQAMGTTLKRDAKTLGLTKDSYLLEAVRANAKDLFEYLTKSSSYKAPTPDNLEVQEAAKVILANWDKARENATDDEEELMAVGEIEVPPGEMPPLF